METLAKISGVTIDCSAVARGETQPFKYGERKTSLPEWDKERCIRCGICYVYCPDGAVVRLRDGFFEAKTDSCSGCGICHRECLCGVISMVGQE